MIVPTYQRQAQQQGLPNAQQNISVDANNFIGGTEQAAIKDSASALSNMGQAAHDLYAQQLHEANQIRIKSAQTDLLTHIQDTMYGANGQPGLLNTRGADAFLGSDGKTVSDLAYEGALAKQDAIAATLSNDQQKAEFKNSTASMLSTMRGQIMGYEAEQHRVYAQSTLESSNAAQANNITLNYNNPDGIKSSIEQMKANSDQLATLHGFDKQWAAVHAQSNISTALNKSIDAATINGDHNTALKILHDFSPDMNQNDLLQNYQKITKAQNDIDAISAATNTMNSLADRFAPQAGDRLMNLVFGQESGGKQLDDNGQPMTSKKGAMGIAQVMPETGPEAARLAGLPWDENKYKYDRDYNAALGKAYLQKQLQTNHGDLQKGLAAYNAGPGALQNAIKQADKDGGNWLDYLPKETRVYVAAIANKYAAGDGNLPPPTLQEAQQHTLAQLPHATMDQRATALQEITRRYRVNQEAIKAHDDYSTAEALRGLEKNGGNFMALPQDVRAAIPAEDRSKVLSFARLKQAGRPESNLAVYNHLTANPDFLAGLSEDQYMKLAPELSDADFKHFATQRASLKNPTVGDSPDTLDSGSVNSNLNNLLSQVGIDPTPKDSDTAARMQVGAIRKYVNDSLLSAQAQTGKKMKDVEIEKYVSGLFAKSATFRTSFMGIDTGTKSGRIMTLTAKDIPSDDRKMIKAQFKARGITPSDGDMLSYYWHAQHTKGAL